MVRRARFRLYPNPNPNPNPNPHPNPNPNRNRNRNLHPKPNPNQVLSALLGAHRGQSSVSTWSCLILQFHHTVSLFNAKLLGRTEAQRQAQLDLTPGQRAAAVRRGEASSSP